MANMIDKLKDVYARYESLSEKMSDPAVISDTAEWTKIAKAQSEIAETAQKYAEYAEVEKQKTQAEEAVKTETDLEMKELLYAEIEDCKDKLA
ncbi:MAG: PCRF domain-containing protein, partial [Clostridia bacterium]|nr:PCRF domain-containing protein [Clostridia bacterium]